MSCITTLYSNPRFPLSLPCSVPVPRRASHGQVCQRGRGRVHRGGGLHSGRIPEAAAKHTGARRGELNDFKYHYT
jgi:hypothetical protein